jgi:hypothetical protein
MAQFNYTLPSGATFTMQAPEGTTQDQADFTFYSQVAAGALVGFEPGQSISGTTSALAKFELSRLDRGTAGVDDTVILAIINGLPTVADLPSLINTPLTNPITQANIAAIAGTGFTAPAIGSLTSNQTLALMAQVANTVDQAADVISDETGVGQYGLSCQQLEMAGYVKPGTWQQFLQNTSNTLTEVLGAPGIWTGLNGIYSLAEFLASSEAQNDAQAKLMQNGYNSLQAAGVITTPAAQSVSAVVGRLYTGEDQAFTTAAATLTNSVNGQVAQLVTNAGRYGTRLTEQWASGLPPVTDVTSNLVGIQFPPPNVTRLATSFSLGLGSLTSGITPNLASVKTAMNSLAKGAEFASTASSTLIRKVANLPNLNVSNLTSNLPSVSALTGQIQGRALAAAGQLQGQITGQANALLTQAQGQANALLAQTQGQFNSLIAQGDSLVSNVQKAAGFANTVNRASVDTAFTKILGSAKIPVPSFGADLPSSASIGAALDISKAQAALKNLQGQGTALLNQAQGLAGQAQGLANQAQGQANNLLAGVRTSVNQIV